VEILVKNKILVNLVDEDGNTALHVAAQALQVQVIMFLVSERARADVRIENTEGKTAS
jgi:ankyrin repeat protein